MSCQHPRTHEDLPCPWPGCPEGTPQQTVVLLLGTEGVVHARQGVGMRIEADGGARMFRRKQAAGGWDWEETTPKG